MKNEVYLIVSLQAKQGNADQLRSALVQLRSCSLLEKGCASYRLAQAEEEGKFNLLETWVDQAALDSHQSSQHFVEWVGVIQACSETVEMRSVRWLE